MALRRDVWMALVFVGVAAVAALLIDGRSSSAPVARMAPPLGASTAADGACPAWTLVAGRGTVVEGTVALFTDGVARLGTCPGAPARLRLVGTTVRGVGAWAVLANGDGVVFADHVGPEGVEVAVEGPAWLSFTNDLVSGDEDRNLRATLR